MGWRRSKASRGWVGVCNHRSGKPGEGRGGLIIQAAGRGAASTKGVSSSYTVALCAAAVVGS